MAIQWYPGHMFKASKEMKQVLPSMDLIIEVLDARIPYSSENPMIAEIRGDKPCIKILNKRDLADDERTEEWQAYLEQQRNVKTLALTTDQPAKIQQIRELCYKLLPNSNDKALYTMIMGIPNVGKSTLINILAGRIIAKTGNEPAVTKRQQRIRLADDLYLSDTPGILWPRVSSEDSGYRLGMTGAVKDTALDYTEVAFYAAEFFLSQYPSVIQERYNLTTLPSTPLALLETIGRQRGCIGAGGLVDLHKVSVSLMNDYRSGALGKMTLETPEMVEAEIIQTQALEAQKAAEKEAKKAERLARRRKRR